jgi:signal transduction histidine kinase
VIPAKPGRLAWSSVGATATLAAATSVLVTHSGRPTGVFEVVAAYSLRLEILLGAALLVFPIVGAIIASRRPGHPIGWLFCGAGMSVALAHFAGTYAFHALDTNPGSLPGGAAVELISDGLWLPTIALTTVFLFLFFPTGRLRTRAERLTAWIAGIAALLGGPIAALIEPYIYPAPTILNPLPTRLPAAVFGALSGTAFFALTGCLLASTALLIRRFRRSAGEEREQLRWFLFASGLVLVTAVPTNLVDSPPELLVIVNLGALLLLPITVAVAILKYRLFEIDVVIRKTAVYAILAAAIVAAGALAIAIVGSLASGAAESRIAVLVLGAAMGFAIWPLRRIATRIADRLVFGGRRTPYEVLAEFSGRLAETYSSEDVLARMAQIVAAGVGADLAVVWLKVADAFRASATWPPDAALPVTIPDDAVEVRHQGEVLGAISVAMPANDPITPTRQALIGDLAAQAGPVLRNVRLVEELRESRRRIVSAQDARARKLERDIHDGAQQQLVALAVKGRLLAGLIGSDDERARALVEQLQIDVEDALQTLRDLARGIYPPLLADRGLAAAIEAQARKSPVPVTVAADAIGRFAQDVESAVYFSCLEALQNIAKHARATRAFIRLAEGVGELLFAVSDDGIGFDAEQASPGTGLQGMIDRIDAVGGSVEIVSVPGEGTQVRGRIPIGSGPPA